MRVRTAARSLSRPRLTRVCGVAAGIREQKRVDSARLRRRDVGRGGFTLTAAAVPAKGKAAVVAKGKAAAAPAIKKKVADVKGKAGAAAALAKEKPDVVAVLKKASASAFRGGVAGFAAGVLQARGCKRARKNPELRAGGLPC